MDIISSKDAKNNFGKLISSAQLNPVEIQRNGNSVAVILSSEEYKRLEELEDKYWIMQSQNISESEFLSAESSEKQLQEILLDD